MTDNLARLARVAAYLLSRPESDRLAELGTIAATVLLDSGPDAQERWVEFLQGQLAGGDRTLN